MHGMHRNLPDAEEAQDMVNAVGIKVFRHLLEAAHPPGIAILLHDVPVVGRESPVLPIHREVIGWRTGLSIQVEVVGLRPSLYAVAADTDGDIAFEHYTMLVCIFAGGKQLAMQVELDIEVDARLLVTLLAERLDLLRVIGRKFGPLAEVRSAKCIAQVAEGCVGLQPLLVGFKELLELLRGEYRFPFLLEDEVEVLPLHLIHSLIVYLGQGIQLFLAAVEGGHLLLVLQCAELTQVGVHRVERIDGDAVVGIRVGPRMGDGGVIDGQNLNGPLIGLYGPVNHQLQVTEVAHTHALLRAEGEDGNGCTCTLPLGQVEIDVAVAGDQGLVGF